jgi:hypothetical protein
VSALRLAAGEVGVFGADERQCGERASKGGGEANDKKIAAGPLMDFRSPQYCLLTIIVGILRPASRATFAKRALVG